MDSWSIKYNRYLQELSKSENKVDFIIKILYKEETVT